jgi:hypothetical protein
MSCDIEALKGYLREAEAAYNDLLTGKLVREFTDQNGERVTYTAARKGDLLNYIVELQGKINGTIPCGARTTEPLRIIF